MPAKFTRNCRNIRFRGLGTPGRFSAIFLQGRQYFLLADMRTKPLLKRGLIQKKTNCPSFLFRVDTFSEGRKHNFHRVVSLNSIYHQYLLSYDN